MKHLEENEDRKCTKNEDRMIRKEIRHSEGDHKLTTATKLVKLSASVVLEECNETNTPSVLSLFVILKHKLHETVNYVINTHTQQRRFGLPNKLNTFKQIHKQR